MQFAIIIPTYNRAQILPRAIRSVLAQDYADWILYIVDDNSGDDTESAVSPYLADPRVRYVRNPVNRGTLHSLNVALDRIEADGADWLTWMDDDDQLVEDGLKTARREIERYPGFGMFVFSAEDAEGKSLTRMETSGPANYLRERLLKKFVGDAREIVAVPCLNGARLSAPSTGAQKYWFGEISLRTGSVFCNTPLTIKEYLDNGITMKERGLGWREKTEHHLRLEMFLVRHWLGVIRRHPCSRDSYRVWIKVLERAVKRWLRLRFFGPPQNER